MNFTEIQQKIWVILSDGLPHKRETLLKCLPDELSSINSLHAHFARMRPKVREHGMDIICQFIRRSNHFRLIGLVTKEKTVNL